MGAEQLQLRGLHLPEPVGWWPPAVGWWIVLFAGIAVLFAVLVWIRRWRYGNIRKLALSELKSLRENSKIGPQQRITQLSILLRRVSVSAFPREQVAGLTGERWLEFLNRSVPGEPFSDDAGRALVEAPYREQTEANLDEVFALCRRWLQSLPKNLR